MKNLKSIIAALSLAATFTMSTANATPVTIKFDGFANGYKNVSVDLDTPDFGGTFRAGMYDLSQVGTSGTWLDSVANNEIYAFCVELDESIGIGSTTVFDLVKAEDVLSVSSVTTIAKLLSSLPGFGFNGTVSGEIQASIWELVYDEALPGDFGAGNFETTTFTTSSILADANAYTGPIKYELFVLSSVGDPGKQDLLVWREVSAPSTLALFVLAGGLIAMRARKQKLISRA
jgi:hypothetical protein